MSRLADLIEVSHLTSGSGRRVAVADLSFRVEPGTFTGFLGPNGAGKTTTLRALLGLLQPTPGTATSRAPYRSSTDPARRSARSSRRTRSIPGRTGRNHLRIVAAPAGIPDARVDEVLELVDLAAAANRRAKGYSLGMKQRLSLAAALLGDPQVLVLDEPAIGLDPQGSAGCATPPLARGTRAHCARLEPCADRDAQIADDVVIIPKGRLVTQSTDGGRARSGAARDAGPLARARKLAAALERAGRQSRPLGDDAARRGGADRRRWGSRRCGGIVLHELSPARTLEDVFLELTGGRAHRDEGPLLASS